jgi:geranylgeranyl diphosphate synthase type II
MVKTEAYLKPEIERLRRRVNERLGELIPGENDPPESLHRAMRHSLLALGKRLRPLMTLLTAEVLGADASLALDPACAVEMIHTASLMLDDLPCMDDAALRRGRETAHRVYGEEIATLASVTLLNRAYAVTARAERLDTPMRLQLVDLLARTVEGLVGGQICDLRCSGQLDAQALEWRIGQKTALLFVAGAEIGAQVARAGSEQVRAVRAFAWNLGLCYQILDDLADRHGTADTIGKDVGKDERKATFVSVLGPGEAEARARAFAATAHEELAAIGPAAARLSKAVSVLFAPTLRTVPSR